MSFKRVDKGDIETLKHSLNGLLFLFFSIIFTIKSIKLLLVGLVKPFFILLSCSFLFVLVYFSLNRGIKNESLYNSTSFIKAPTVKYKILALLFLLIALFLLSYVIIGYDIAQTFALMFSVGLGWYLYYGFDPFVDKISDEIDGKVFEKVNKNIAFAVKNIQTLKDLNTKISNISVGQKLSKVIEIYERKIYDIKNSPMEFDRYRKFMSVYLEELVNIVKDFTEYANEDGLKDKLISLLDLIVEGIKRKERDVNSSDMESLEIDIEVLREELKRG